MKTLPLHFYQVRAELAQVTASAKEVRELMLHTGGEAFINGRLYMIKAKNLGAGAYKITIKEKDYAKT